jgi:hypothetical protein
LVAAAWALAVAGCGDHTRIDLGLAWKAFLQAGESAPALAQPSSLEPRAPAVRPAPVQNDYFRLELGEASTCAMSDPTLPPDRELLTVAVSVEAVGELEVPANPFYAELTDADGRAYRARFRGCEPGLGGPPLRRGERARGLLSFEIPRAARDLRLSYRPRLGTTGEVAPLALSLGR